MLKFIQVIEQTGDIEEVVAHTKNYLDTVTDTKVQAVQLCTDRDDPTKIINIVTFESAESAGQNDDLEETQEDAAKQQAETDITYRNLDLRYEFNR